jgi:hypothetical protein
VQSRKQLWASLENWVIQSQTQIDAESTLNLDSCENSRTIHFQDMSNNNIQYNSHTNTKILPTIKKFMKVIRNQLSSFSSHFYSHFHSHFHRHFCRHFNETIQWLYKIIRKRNKKLYWNFNIHFYVVTLMKLFRIHKCLIESIFKLCDHFHRFNSHFNKAVLSL